MKGAAGCPRFRAAVATAHHGADLRVRLRVPDVRNPCPAGSESVEPDGDFTVALDGEDEPVANESARYFAAGTAQQTVFGGAIQYHHGELIASTVATTDRDGCAAATTAYTAFGEPIPGAAADPHDVRVRLDAGQRRPQPHRNRLRRREDGRDDVHV